MFLANFVAATTLGLFLLAPVRLQLGQLGKLFAQLAALAGVGVATGALAALLISEHTPLFGFREHGYRFAIVLAITSEATAIAMLTLFLVRVRSHARQRSGVPPYGELINHDPSPGQPRGSDAEALRDHDSQPLDEGRLPRGPAPPAR